MFNLCGFYEFNLDFVYCSSYPGFQLQSAPQINYNFHPPSIKWKEFSPFSASEIRNPRVQRADWAESVEPPESRGRDFSVASKRFVLQQQPGGRPAVPRGNPDQGEKRQEQIFRLPSWQSGRLPREHLPSQNSAPTGHRLRVRRRRRPGVGAPLQTGPVTARSRVSKENRALRRQVVLVQRPRHQNKTFAAARIFYK